MNSKNRQRRSSLALIFVFGSVVILLALALALAGGGGGKSSPYQSADRSAPESVHQRVSAALEANNGKNLYDELSPTMKSIIPPNSFSSSQTASVSLQTIQPPQIKTDPPWNGEWADTLIRVTRNGVIEEYVARYHLENGEWWLYATLQVK